MTAIVDPRLASRMKTTSRMAAVTVALLALVVMAGWALDIESLRTLMHSSHVAMNPLTAVAFLAAAVSVWLWQPEPPVRSRRWSAVVLDTLVTLIGALRLLSYRSGWDLGLDRALFTSRLAGNRMAPNTAFGFILVGLALALLETPIAGYYWPSQLPALTVAALSLLSLTGYLHDTLWLYHVNGQIPMALNTALGFSTISVAILSLRPRREPVAVLVSATADGEMARRLMPATFLIPLMLGWLRAAGERRGLYNAAFGVEVFTVLIVVAFSGVLWWCATVLRRADQERRRAQKLLECRNDELSALASAEHDAVLALQEAQSQLVQSEKLASLGQMVAGVAHEINNPLSFVSNNVAVLQRDMASMGKLLRLYQLGEGPIAANDPALAGQIKELCEVMDLAYTLPNLEQIMIRSREGLRRIQQIVKDLREFARLDESELHPVQLNPSIESTVNMIRVRAESKGVEITQELGELPMVSCYPAKVNQVVMNLLSNAIDACAEGGRVKVRSSLHGEEVLISVEDNGQGIEPAVREKIFDPFFTTKPQGQGTGLGLSISYGIVRDHGGSIEVQSAVGKGSCFTIHLPLDARGKGDIPKSAVLRSSQSN